MLDTNMLSEIMRPEPDNQIADWIVRQPSNALFTAAVCRAEILSGLVIMPSGTVDLMLAAIARVRGATVVTRNVADFEGVGLAIVDPWDA